MKSAVIAALLLLASAPALAARVDVPSLPPSPYADTEASTNLPLRVNAAALQSLTLSVSFGTCETNEVLVAIGRGTRGG